MLAAHLRGIKLPKHSFGHRSDAFELVVLEALGATIQRESYMHTTVVDVGKLAQLTEDGRNSTFRRICAQVQRAAELGYYDIYKFGSTRTARKGGISLLKLFQAMEKGGIMAPMSQEAWEEEYARAQPLMRPREGT